MKKCLTSLFLIVLISLTATCQTKTNLELLDIFNMEYVSDPQISPDGSKVVYVRNFKDVMTDKNLSNLWLVNVDGTRNRPLTTGNQNDFAPRWSHKGDKIVYKSNKEDQKMKLYMMWMDTREVVPLTNLPQTPGEVSWSTDDEFLAFNMFVPKEHHSIVQMPDKPEGAEWNTPPTYIDRINYRGDGAGYLKSGNMQLFTLPVNGGTPRQLTSSEFDHGAPVWALDNRTLYFSANMHKEEEFEPLNSEIYQIEVRTGSTKPLTSRYGPDLSPALSPDGKKIAFTGFDDKHQGYQVTHVYVMNTDGSGLTWLSKDFDRDVQNIKWSKDGKGLYFQFDDQGKTKLGHISLSGKVSVKAENLGGLSLGRPYNEAQFSVSDKDQFAYTMGTPEHPAYLALTDGKGTKRLTSLNEDLFSFKNIGEVEEIWWNSSFDQRKIQGWIVKPPNFDKNKKYPFILEIHGGPFASYGAVYSAEIQAFAAAGYVVLYANPRGSTGYGEEFGNLI
ncbi:MAG: DPP IV N-terminal domain-containing protein, partial [Lutimonas sp.]